MSKLAKNRHAVKSHARRDTARQLARARRREPVETRYICPLCSGGHHRDDCDLRAA